MPRDYGNEGNASLGFENAGRNPNASLGNVGGAMTSLERQFEDQLIGKLLELKYEQRADIRDRATLEKNFREKFEALNRVRLTDGEFQRLLDEIITPDVYTAARTLRGINSFTRDDGTPRKIT